MENEIVLKSVCEAKMAAIESRLNLVISIQLVTFAAIAALVLR